MKVGRREVLIAALGSAVVAAVGVATLIATPPAEAVQSGAAAPGFTAVDQAGRTRSLDEFAGQTVVLEWTNDRCPYVRKHYETGNMQTLQREAAMQGVVWLTIVSSAPGKQGHVSGAQAQALTTSRNAAPAVVLLDPSGAVGRLYGARTTPHMYVIAPDRKLVFQGGIDDRNSADHATVQGARNYVREALAAVRAGRAPAVAAAAPYGCSIKYADS
jgi:peroxiredoxin